MRYENCKSACWCDDCTGCQNYVAKDDWHDAIRSEIQTVLNQVRKLNPYPKEVFTEPTKYEYDLMNKALKEYGLIPDKFFGSWGRRVWENCINDIEDIFNDDKEGRDE